jgi:hypothetical protein
VSSVLGRHRERFAERLFELLGEKVVFGSIFSRKLAASTEWNAVAQRQRTVAAPPVRAQTENISPEMPRKLLTYPKKWLQPVPFRGRQSLSVAKCPIDTSREGLLSSISGWLSS